MKYKLVEPALIRMIINYLKAIIKVLKSNKIKDSESTLIYIHIGKCGGSSLWNSICESEKIKKQFRHKHKIHIEQPPLLNKARYIIVIRNPITRALSAFNWRYKLVVKDELQKTRFAGEWDTLVKYKTFNALAEALYCNGILNEMVVREFKSIHHLKEDIKFYLSDFLENIKSEQLEAVFATESLDDDIKSQLDVINVNKVHENSIYTRNEYKELSNIAYNNLKKFLKQDYDCIAKLLNIKNTTMASKHDLLK